jgi:tetratricopeptide (TPR) repeat protein
MLCPFCLKEGTIKRQVADGRYIYVCSEHPETKIPVAYAEDETIPRDVISAVGFRGHGKSAYFTSLFSVIDDLAEVWPGFFYSAIDENSLDKVTDRVKSLKGGKLPEATPATFPIPTIIQFSEMPQFRNRFLIFYDTGGENFERESKLTLNANFVVRSQTAIFFLSLEDLQYNPQEMHRLLQTYINGLRSLGGDPKQQHLLVVLTKGDLLKPKLESRPEVWKYLVDGDITRLKKFDYANQIHEMNKISRLLKDFLVKDVHAKQFVNLGSASFRTMDFSIISSFGSAPKGDQLEISANPKRIFDPILWVMYNSSGRGDTFYPIKQFFAPSKSVPTVMKSPVSETPKKPLSNRGLLFWLGGSLLFLFIAMIIIGAFSHPSTGPSSVSAVPTTIPLPLVNQTDVASVQKGVSLLNAGNYLDALNEFDLALAKNPQSATIWNYKGFALFKLDRNDEAVQAYDHAIALEQNNILAWNNKGYALTALEKYEDADSAFDHVLSTDSKNKDALMGKGTSLYLNRNYSSAIDVLKMFIVLDPKNIQALTYLGESLQNLKRNSEAIDVYNQILELSPNDKQILLHKGQCLNSIEDYTNATAVFDKLITIDPKNKEAFSGKGTALLQQKKPQDALTAFNAALALDPNYVRALTGKGNAQLDLKNTFDALQTLNKALEIDPQNSDAWECKGRIFKSQGKYNDALFAFDQALKYDSTSLDALSGKADVLVSLENYNEAITVLDFGLSLDNTEKELWNKKGYALFKKGDNTLAVTALDKATDLDSKYTAAWTNKGYALSGLNQFNLSIQSFDKAIEINPNYKEAWLGKSIVYTKMGDFKASEEAAKQAMTIK